MTGRDQDAALDRNAIDLSNDIPHSARVSNYLLGGRTNFTADRELTEKILRAFPEALGAAWEHEFFTQRAALHLAERGMRQFLDIGTGIPRAAKLHGIVQSLDPSARVVYLDNDPIVIQHLQALMISNRLGKVGVVHGDLADPERILAALAAEGTLDMDTPIALCLTAVLEHLPDEHSPQEAVKTLTAALAPDSALMLTHIASDLRAQETEQVAALCRSSGMPLYPRNRQQIEGYFDGWELIDPGITTPARWHPISTPGNAEFAACYAGVALTRPSPGSSIP